MYVITLQLVTVAVFHPEGIPSGHADAVELDLTVVPVCGAACKGEHCIFRGIRTESQHPLMVL